MINIFYGLVACVAGFYTCRWHKRKTGQFLPFTGPPRANIGQMAVQCFCSAVSILLVVVVLTGLMATQTDAVRSGPAEAVPFVMLCGIVPVLETVLFSMLPALLLRRVFNMGNTALWVCLTLLFLVIHMVSIGPAIGLAVGIGAGGILSALYVGYLPRIGYACAVTAVTHSIYNAFIYAISG